MPPTTATTPTPTPGYLHFCVTHASDVAAPAALRALAHLWDAQPPAVREAYAADAAALALMAGAPQPAPPPPPASGNGGAAAAAGGGFVLFCQSKKKELGGTLGRSGGQAALGRLWGEEPAEARVAWNKRAEALAREWESCVRRMQRLDALGAVVGGGGGGGGVPVAAAGLLFLNPHGVERSLECERVKRRATEAAAAAAEVAAAAATAAAAAAAPCAGAGAGGDAAAEAAGAAEASTAAPAAAVSAAVPRRRKTKATAAEKRAATAQLLNRAVALCAQEEDEEAAATRVRCGDGAVPAAAAAAATATATDATQAAAGAGAAAAAATAAHEAEVSSLRDELGRQQQQVAVLRADLAKCHSFERNYRNVMFLRRAIATHEEEAAVLEDAARAKRASLSKIKREFLRGVGEPEIPGVPSLHPDPPATAAQPRQRRVVRKRKVVVAAPRCGGSAAAAADTASATAAEPSAKRQKGTEVEAEVQVTRAQQQKTPGTVVERDVPSHDTVVVGAGAVATS